MMQTIHAMSPPLGEPSHANSPKAISSPPYQNGKFIVSSAKPSLSVSDMISGVWNHVTNGTMGRPKVKLPLKPVDLSHFSGLGGRQLTATWLGHSSLMINIDGYRVLTDPVFEKKVSLVGPTRFNGEVPVDPGHIPKVDTVIISHDHYDHLNKYSIKLLIPKAHRFIVPRGVGSRLAKWGVPKEKIVELQWWEEYRFDPGLTIAATPAQHFSGRGLTDGNSTLWVSWVVRSPHHNIFFSGDSGYFTGFKRIGEKYGPFDMTFIECGAYNTAWSQVHMFPEQTVQAHLDVGGKVLHPIHWGTFNLSMHPWYEPMERLSAAAETADVSIATPIVGDTTILHDNLPHTQWWRKAMVGSIASLKESKERENDQFQNPMTWTMPENYGKPLKKRPASAVNPTNR